MPELLKCYVEQQPAVRFIGKKYLDQDRNEFGSFGSKWMEWFANDWFTPLHQLMPKALQFEHQLSNIGLMREKQGEPFQYWIGMFCPITAKVPEGYQFIDFPSSTLGVTWIEGKEPDIYGKEGQCADLLGKNGHTIVGDKAGAFWFYERYVCPRFTKPNEQGHRILDIVFFIK